MNAKALLNSNVMPKKVTIEQKAADIAAINSLLHKHGLEVTSGVESLTMISYRVKLTPDCNINKLLKLQPNLCIAMNDDTVKLYREKNELVIEKKGADNTVYTGDLCTDYFNDHKGLALILGYDTHGQKIYTDLKKAPHILIAGTTGSGKSVLENVMIISLLTKYPDLEMYGIDTKRVEFQSFTAAPNFHLITDAIKATETLKNLCDEMERRYMELVKARANNIDEYNSRPGHNMKPIVVVIDEFADLMLLSGKSVEEHVVRLAQKARACGIHLIIATQRPTRDVITGLIKANIPTKICLKVTSALDSRIVLDRNGGETLIGKGDMLYLANGAYDPIRVQGCYITEPEKIAIASAAARETIKTETAKQPESATTARNFFSKLFA